MTNILHIKSQEEKKWLWGNCFRWCYLLYKGEFYEKSNQITFGRGVDCLNSILVHRGKIYFIPHGSNRCLVGCLDYLLILIYLIECLEFYTQGWREQVRNQTTYQSVCIFASIDCVGFFYGKEVLPRCVNGKNKNVSIFTMINFCDCQIWSGKIKASNCGKWKFFENEKKVAQNDILKKKQRQLIFELWKNENRS